ncbi:MAG: histidinol-phosphate transaminase [Muribaculaceae bacterium]|nr:histidinol-phosphate transaminase [Muribaculaceae bacterium]
MKKYIRKNILDLEPYSTARDEFQDTGHISVWLDANESPYPNGVNRYPDPHQKELKRKVAQLFGVAPESIFIGGSGSDEAIDLIFRIFCRPGIDNVVAIAPSYGVYAVAAAVNDVAVREVLLDEDFSLPAERILAATDSHTKIIWICSPNNPTGNAFPVEQLKSIAGKFDGMVVVDEAYADFSDKGSMLPLLGSLPNLIVLRTFSKAWGMAGLRAGMAFASPEVIGYFSRVKYPYNMSSLIQQELLKRIDANAADVRTQIMAIKTQRSLLETELAKLPIVKRVYPSDANFLLVKVENADALYDYLAGNGVIVRNRSKMPLCADTLRFTIGTPEENRRTLSLLKAYPDGAPAEPLQSSCADNPGRCAEVIRKTSETDIFVSVDLEGGKPSAIDTGLKFFDHMLDQIPHHAGISLTVRCKGDLEVDEHHTMEDVAITLGEALSKALGDKRGIERYGFVLPMDEARAMVLIDLGGRIDFSWDVQFTREYVGDTPTEMFRHFFHSLCCAMKCNLHVSAKGENNHHIIEGVFKAFARALKMAVRRDPFSYELPSSKGIL